MPRRDVSTLLPPLNGRRNIMAKCPRHRANATETTDNDFGLRTHLYALYARSVRKSTAKRCWRGRPAYAYDQTMSETAKSARQLKRLRKMSGLSVRKFAELLSMKPSSYQHYEDRYKKRRLPHDLIMAANTVLSLRGVPDAELETLFDGWDMQAPLDELMADRDVPLAGVRLDTDKMRENSIPLHISDFVPADKLVGPADLPVYASAMGGPGAMVVTFEPIEYVKRPEPLAGVTKGYGVYVVGDSMEPKYKHGDMLLVHPSRPYKAGDYVVVIMSSSDATHEVMVKRFISPQTIDPGGS